jgi:hypothetical protein
MQKLLLIVSLIVFLHMEGAGQARDYVLNTGFQAYTMSVTPLTDGRWLIITSADSLVLLITKADHTPIVRKTISPSYYQVVGLQVLGTPDGGFVVTIQTIDCDTGGPTFFRKYNANGHQEWESIDNSLWASGGIVPDKVVVGPDGNLIGLKNKVLHKIGLHTGLDIWSKPMYAGKPFSIHDFALISGTEDAVAVGVPNLQRWHATGPANNPYYTLERDTDFYAADNFSAVQRGGDWYYTLDYTTQKILGFKLPDWSTNWLYTHATGHSLYNYSPLPDGLLLLEKDATGYKILKAGLSGQISGQSSISPPWLTPLWLGGLGDTVLVAGTNRSDPNLSPYPGDTYYATDIWFRTMPSLSAPEPIDSMDAAITDVDQMQGIQVDTFPSSGGPLFPSGTNYSMKGGHFRVQVTNKGTQTLNSVVVRMGLSIGIYYYCYSGPRQPVVYHNLNLAPGASTWLDFGDIAINHQPSIAGQICFWTSAPDHHPDADHSNDVFCKNVYTTHCSNPTVACRQQPFLEIQSLGSVQMSAIQLAQAAQDNCTTLGQLAYSMRLQGTGSGFPQDSSGNPISIMTFGCADIGQHPVELWVRDGLGHTDSCVTQLTVLDTYLNCPADSSKAILAGRIFTETNNNLGGALVDIADSDTINYTYSTQVFTPTNGLYKSNTVPLGLDIAVTPSDNEFPLNGVSTYDLVQISKHVLGLQALSSPYKIIAADANHNGAVTTADIVEIRKLILGIIPTFTNNTSWRFVDANYMFPHPNAPLQDSFPESIKLSHLAGNTANLNFVAVKVGDVNGSAIANVEGGVEERGKGRLVFDVTSIRTNPTPNPSPRGEGGLHSVPVLGGVGFGEVFTVDFRAEERVQGYQFTMNLDGLEVIDIVPGAGMKAEHFGVFPDAITTSFEGDVVGEFSVKFRALKSGRLSEMLGVSSRITQAEGYDANGDLLDIAFRFNDGETATVSQAGFELYQNQPNPAAGKTVIGFYLHEAAVATLYVYDQAGRLVYTRTGDFSKGSQQFTVDGASFGAPGVYAYRVSTATDSATRIMILGH